MQDLGQMIEKTAFDNACMEHLCYYSLRTFTSLLNLFDLDVVKVERRTINGGSLRIFVRRDRYVTEGVDTFTLLKAEEPWTSDDALAHFAYRVGQVKEQLLGLLHYLRPQGPVDVYATSTKFNTLAQVVGLSPTLIRYGVERTPEKWGRVTSGSRIPIIAEAEWRKDPAPVTLVGAWGFRDAFLKREAEYLRKGGSFVFPLPHLEIVYGGK
jgi:hypothetical protein